MQDDRQQGTGQDSRCANGKAAHKEVRMINCPTDTAELWHLNILISDESLEILFQISFSLKQYQLGPIWRSWGCNTT